MSRRFLFRLFAAAVPTADHVSDRELLRRFVATRDSAAFELIVRRHADAVWTAARRVVGNDADADDVFQAAFLALVRKAATIRESCVGGWLHRVAVNAALKANGRRQPAGGLGRAGSVSDGTTPSVAYASGSLSSPDECLARDELASIIHQELARLPDRYRLPVVLCDLEGQTHAEAAKVLGWPIGSVSGRLSRAHRILRDRLTRRGLTAPAALLTASVAPTSSVATASGIATGSVVASPIVSTLTEGVLYTMRLAKLKLTTAILTATGLVAMAGVGTVAALTQIPSPRGSGEQPPKVAEQPPPKVEPPAEAWTPKGLFAENGKVRPGRVLRAFNSVPTAFPDLNPPNRELDKDAEEKLLKMCPRIFGDDPPAVVPTDDTYRRLLKARLHQGRGYIQKVEEVIVIGNWQPAYFSELLLCLNDMRNVAVELWSNDPKTLIPWLEEFVIMGKHVEDFFRIRVQTGNDPPHNLFAARRHRLEAEAALAKLKRRG